MEQGTKEKIKTKNMISSYKPLREVLCRNFYLMELFLHSFILLIYTFYKKNTKIHTNTDTNNNNRGDNLRGITSLYLFFLSNKKKESTNFFLEHFQFHFEIAYFP
jgi:hypothetical protein